MITRDRQDVVATAEVNDAYRVELHQAHDVTEYSPAEARALATELQTAAADAESMLVEAGGGPRERVHLAPEPGVATLPCCGRSPFDVGGFDRISWDGTAVTCSRPASHAFDIAPTCRECDEGKHGACDGTALVEIGSFVQHLACGCAAAGHVVIGTDVAAITRREAGLL